MPFRAFPGGSAGADDVSRRPAASGAVQRGKCCDRAGFQCLADRDHFLIGYFAACIITNPLAADLESENDEV
jgi:hypothetical protein